ncbi:MAG: dipicolinate synthase subunit DpsA, partial [Clostridia bacterium]|nr:dipicolinate synthase subunit DpsA [Clostridia bacterium]
MAGVRWTPTFAVLGGDRRESEAARYLLQRGALVRMFGVPADAVPDGASPCSTVAAALTGAEAVLAPVRGIRPDGTLAAVVQPAPRLTVQDLDGLAPGAVFIVGSAPPWLSEAVKARGGDVVELLRRDDFALLNAVPTAEGAIQLAMEHTDITIADSRCLVLGGGRTGIVLAQRLHALQARVTVVARNPAQRALAQALGCGAAAWEDLPRLVEDADILFNTVPAVVLTRNVLLRARPDVLILDLASEPGGVDGDAAHRLGCRVLTAPGLPGRVAPRSTGLAVGRLAWEVAVAGRGRGGGAVPPGK